MDTTDLEREAMTDCTSFVGSLIPATDEPLHPAMLEQIAIHDAAQALLRRLAREGKSYQDILPQLQEFVANRPTPVLDAHRRMANV